MQHVQRCVGVQVTHPSQGGAWQARVLNASNACFELFVLHDHSAVREFAVAFIGALPHVRLLQWARMIQGVGQGVPLLGLCRSQ